MELRPMLAAKLRDVSDLRFPIMGTPKLDGVRALKREGRLVSRAFKPIRNLHISALAASLPDGLDGELMVDGETFGDVTSAVMRYDGTPAFEYWVFDYTTPDLPYYQRIAELSSLSLPSFVRLVLPTYLTSLDTFLSYRDECLAAGHEGVVLRDALGSYKHGRSTLREHGMLKWKEHDDSEAVILSLVEASENTNPIVPNAYGLAKRPGGRGGKVPKGTMGAMQVRDLHSGVTFEIGTGKGLTAALRQRMWDDPLHYVGRIVRYTHQACGAKDRPRFPSFQGFRDEEDT